MLGVDNWREFSADGLYAHPAESSQQLVEAAILVGTPVRAPTTPKSPADPFKGSLPVKVRHPFVWTMIRVAVQFNGKPSVVSAFDHEVDTITSDLNLRTQAIPEVKQLLANLALER